MFATLLSVFIVLATWAIAYLFAIPAEFLVHYTRLDAQLAFPASHPFSKLSNRKFLRGLIFATLLIMLDLSLATLLGERPTRDAWEFYFQNLTRLEIHPALLKSLVDNIMFFFSIFIIYQTIRLVNTLFPRFVSLFNEWRHSHFHIIRIKGVELFTPDQITDSLISILRFLQIGINLTLLILGLTLGLSIFPGTQDMVYSLAGKALEILQNIGLTFLGYLPNLFSLMVIAVFTRYTLKFLRFLHNGIRNDKIKILGLHKDLTDPTFQLLKFFTIALALVATYPYLPGADSPVFRGITIFIGFLLSLGSTSLVTNIVSGVVLTYTRGLRIGDRVKIGDTVGDVLERTLLVTRIQTIKNAIVTIPNGMVLNNQIINYTAAMVEQGLILHTTITIGYDVPWRTVNELLVQAAEATPAIQADPKPFVFQTSLDDYYVSYELNAYTLYPEQMATIYSALHKNILDAFNAADVEIMSPAFTAYRDGSEKPKPLQQPEQVHDLIRKLRNNRI